MVSLYLKERGHDVLGFARKKSAYVDSVAGDARDIETLRKLIDKGRFHSVINCIGVLNQFAERDKERAVFLNAYLPHFLARETMDTDTQVIHISTDCVFSGRRGGYTEGDLKDGETFYARSKALGELDDGKNITLRSSIVGPDINPEGLGLLNWFLKQNGPVNGYKNSVWTGQTTLQLAKTMASAAAKRTHGLYNAVPDTVISKYELLQLFARHFRGGAVNVVPVDGIRTDKSLIRIRSGFDITIPDYEVMVAELAAWLRAHRNMYPHYRI